MSQSKLFDRTASRPEHRLVLSCCSPSVDDEQVRNLLVCDLDWDYIFRFARRHSVIPLFYQGLSAFSSLGIPAEALTRLKRSYQENAARNVLLTEELSCVLHLLQSKGIEAVPYKGPALAVQAYGDKSLRRFIDLDVIVQKHDVISAKEVLSRIGYAPDKPWSEGQQSLLVRTQHNLPLVRDNGRLLVELHWQVASDLFASSLSAEDLWPRLGRIDLNGRSFKSLSTEDLLLSLCVHGSRHLWERLAWICDIAHLLTSSSVQIDWTALLVRAQNSGNRRMLFLGLKLANVLLRATLPQQIEVELDADQQLISATKAVTERLFSGTKQVPATLRERFRYNVGLREGWRMKLRYCRQLLRPTDGDIGFVHLPSVLTFGYYVVRPFRFITNHNFRVDD